MTDSLVRVSHGLWRPADALTTFVDTTTALLSVSPDGAVLTDLAAARAHGLWVPDVTTEPLTVAVHSRDAVPAGRSHSRRAELRTRRRRLKDSEVEIKDRLLVTTRERTWVDLAELLSLPDLVAAGDSALRSGLSRDALAEAVRAARHRRGVVRARTALPLLDARAESRPESHLRCALISGGLPLPAVNEAIYSSLGEWLGRPDLSYSDVRLALEYNGAVHAEPGRMRRDITRELDMYDRGGWLTITFGPVEVFKRPDGIALTVQRLRRDRAR